MEIKRTFELLDWLRENYPQKPDIINGKRDGQWVNFSVNDYYKFSLLLSYGLYHLGLRQGDKVITVVNNRPEFNIMDMAMSMLGIIHVPIYPTLGQEDYRYIITHSDAKMVVVGNQSIFSRISPIVPDLQLEYGVYTLDHIEGQKELNEVLRQGIFHRKEYAATIEQIKESISENDIATIIYTSGTTGQPKGVMLSHKNLITNYIATAKVQPLTSKDRNLSFLPLCHIYERSLNYHYQYLGTGVYYAENMGTIVNDLADIRARGFCSVPRVLEMVYDKFYAAGKDLPAISKWIYFAAIRHGQRYDYHKGCWFRLQTKIYDKLVYSKWRKKFGGHKDYAVITGGSAIQPRIVRLFSAASIFIYEGYGLSETSPVIAVNNPNKKLLKIGTVGPILEGVEVKFSDEGEILTRGDSLMLGYYKDPEYTAQVIDADGWFHTGDIGELIDGMYLQITDRKKEIFKLSAGKYVAPQMLENRFKESSFIENLMVIGENEKFTSAIISPNFNHLHFWASKHKIHYRDNETLIMTPEVYARIQKEIDKRNKGLSPHEQIKNFRLVVDEWSPATGELSPTLKLKRNILSKKYKNIIDEIYNKHSEPEKQGFSIKQIDITDIHVSDYVKKIWQKVTDDTPPDDVSQNEENKENE
ncbi:MAG: long-chain fatty acid--CoA ligase [Bacteroidales bacterium]|jgi:long-chain acyl-CoA synthetase|nr:long-chain fatty acid--CoA ligase [Bacteroidales bacterium]